jgi:hypothetical protein
MGNFLNLLSMNFIGRSRTAEDEQPLTARNTRTDPSLLPTPSRSLLNFTERQRAEVCSIRLLDVRTPPCRHGTPPSRNLRNHLCPMEIAPKFCVSPCPPPPEHVNQHSGMMCISTRGERDNNVFLPPLAGDVPVCCVVRTDGPRMTQNEPNNHPGYRVFTGH